MSKDFQLAFLCPHLVGEETVPLGTDRRTLYTKKPIQGVGALKVVANDLYDVSPTVGVQSKAKLIAARKEPYQITTATKTLVVRTADQYVNVQLPPGYLSAYRVASVINTGFQALGVQATCVASNENGHLVLGEQVELGPFSKVSVEGTAKDALGFNNQFGTTGRVVLPTWTLFNRSLVEPDTEGYFIRFSQPVKAGYYFKVTYSVAPSQCLRCLTTEVENDYRFDSQNNPLMVDGNNLLYQSCLKVILTELGSNIYYRWYGTNLIQSIGAKALSGVNLAIQQAVRTALTNFQNLQTAQAKYQRVTAKERLYAIDSVVCTPSPVDPTVFLVDVSVRSYSNETVNITIVYTSPGAFALAGTNGLSLGNFGQ